MESRRPELYIRVAALIYKCFQIFFHVLILNAIYYLIFPAIKDKPPGDWAIAMLLSLIHI